MTKKPSTYTVRSLKGERTLTFNPLPEYLERSEFIGEVWGYRIYVPESATITNNEKEGQTS